MWIIFVISVSYARGDQVRISPAPQVAVDVNSNVTLTCDYNGTFIPLDVCWESYQLGYFETTCLNMSCIPIYETSSQNNTFTCHESIGKFQMTIRNVNRDRHGQMWSCTLLVSNNTYFMNVFSNWTRLNITGTLTETSCLKNHDAEICPYPIARVKENETLVIAVKINASSDWRYVESNEETDGNFSLIHGSFVDHNCTVIQIYGIRPAGYNFTCNPSEAITFTWDQVQRDMNGHIISIYLHFDARPSIYIWIIIYVQGKDETPQTPTNPVSTTIFPRSSSPASTSIVSTSQLPPSYVPDPVRTTIFPSSSSTASTSIVSTSQLPLSYVPDPGEYELHLEFDLKVEMAYNETYKDKTSPQFQSLAKNFSISLTEVYKSIKGFKSIDILQFRQGSVHVDYSVNVFGTVDVATVTEEIRDNIVSNLTSIAGVPVNTAYTHASMERRLDNMEKRDKCSFASKYLCPFGYYCKPAIATTSIILCIDRCNSSVCQNNGECYIGHHSDDVQCRCGFSENVVYSGQRCEIKTGVVTVQERNLYLIIACAIVGGILVVFISTVCIINRKRNRLKKRLTISHVLQLDEMHKRSNNGVPAMDERYVISLNPALRRYPEGYCGGRVSHEAVERYGYRFVGLSRWQIIAQCSSVNVSYQDQGLDGGYLQTRDCGRRNSDEDYDYIGPEFEVGSRSQHN